MHVLGPDYFTRRRLVNKMRAARASGQPADLSVGEFKIMFDRMAQNLLGISGSEFLKHLRAGTLPDSDAAEYLVSLAGGNHPASR